MKRVAETYAAMEESRKTFAVKEGENMARYVDAEKFAKEILRAWKLWEKKGEDCFLFSDVITPMLVSQPTVDVRENEHGEWQYGENAVGQDGYYCSHCGRFVPWEYGKVGINFIYRFFFCPSCGAEMKGEKDGKVH